MELIKLKKGDKILKTKKDGSISIYEVERTSIKFAFCYSDNYKFHIDVNKNEQTISDKEVLGKVLFANSNLINWLEGYYLLK